MRLHLLTIFSKWKITQKTRSERKFKNVLVAILALLGFLYGCLSQINFVGPKDLDFKGKNKSEILILQWTTEWGTYENESILTNDKCTHFISRYDQRSNISKVFDKPCKITFDRRYLTASDALLFHSWDMITEKVPDYRDASQLWIYMQRESPIYTNLNLKTYPNIFNWTMTYRRDSDVYYPYGLVVPVLKPNSGYETIKSQLKQKTSLVVWIVSSCNSSSSREYLVKQLQQYIKVDIYGKCGMECPPTSGNCYAHVNKTHKFYLSFENSLCTDYITEKFFNALHSNMVPIVYGGTGSSEYSAIAPKGSYIDVRDFNSPKEIAQYLLHLDKNDEEYMKYFEWKNKFQVINNQWKCNLCQKIYLQFDKSIGGLPKNQHKWYRNLWQWWNYMTYDVSLVDDDEISSPETPACQGPISNLTKGEGFESATEEENIGFI